VKKEYMDFMMSSGQLRIRQVDKERVKSIVKSAETNAGVVRNITLIEDSATVIFREIYESIRQLGDAYWWLNGFEPLNHEISLEILKEMNIKDKIKLNHLSRFKKIRNDANYRGFKISVAQAKEIIEFWDVCGRDIIKKLYQKVASL